MNSRRSSGEVFGLAFLDVISCAFGAIVLLLLISKPALIEVGDEAQPSVDATVLEEAADLVGRLRVRWEALQAMLASEPKRPAASHGQDPALEEAVRLAGERLQRLQRDNRGLERVEESLRRATLSTPAPATERDPEVGGIPVDSEYVIFIVDTSGSMQSIWGEVMDVMGRVLDIHPKVSGFQILNDNGAYLVSGYRKKWIRDTPKLRREHPERTAELGRDVEQQSRWKGSRPRCAPYARQRREDRHLHLRRRFPRVVLRPGHGDAARAQRRSCASGKTRVRVHAVGFVSSQIHDRYATLMREVTRIHDGAFLALPVEGAGRGRVSAAELARPSS